MPRIPPPVPAPLTAEAAAWLARLRNEEHGAADEAAFQAWLSEDQRHAAAFDLVMTTWEAAGGLDMAPQFEEAPLPAAGRRKLVAAGLAAIAAMSAVGFWHATSSETYGTERGEQRRIALADGSSLTLDTDTLVRVAFTGSSRRVELVHGRAHFDVAKDGKRPFSVSAAGREVVAIGTAFDVARSGDEVAVLLVEGRVAVKRADAADAAQTAYLDPGERIVFDRDSTVRQRHPDIDQATAWQEGRAIFHDQPLGVVVAEMNRYSRKPLVVADEQLSAMRISGIYSTRNPEAFAQSVTALLPVSVRTTPQSVLIEPLREKIAPSG